MLRPAFRQWPPRVEQSVSASGSVLASNLGFSQYASRSFTLYAFAQRCDMFGFLMFQTIQSPKLMAVTRSTAILSFDTIAS